jgi:large subunit ribosomal protein L10
MKKEDKNIVIEDISKELATYKYFYLTDTSSLNAEQTTLLRRKCFDNNIKLMVVKNTLLKKAMEKSETDYSEAYNSLHGTTAVMFCDTGNLPARIIKDLRKKLERPLLKVAYIEDTFYIGDNQLDSLTNLKSKDELVADIIALLQSPAKNVLLSLQSGSNKLTGILKTLSER